MLVQANRGENVGKLSGVFVCVGTGLVQVNRPGFSRYLRFEISGVKEQCYTEANAWDLAPSLR